VKFPFLFSLFDYLQNTTAQATVGLLQCDGFPLGLIDGTAVFDRPSGGFARFSGGDDEILLAEEKGDTDLV
jgi:hypothetical protein